MALPKLLYVYEETDTDGVSYFVADTDSHARQVGPVCPDGLVMCCLCFERVPQDELSVTPDGGKEDVCRACAEMERTRTCEMERTRT